MRSTVLAALVVILGVGAPAASQELQGVTFPSARIAFFDAQRVVSDSVTGQVAFAATRIERFQHPLCRRPSAEPR